MAQGRSMAAASALARQETLRLQQLAPDKAAWGNWNPEIHVSGIQITRQYRAYAICNDDRHTIVKATKIWSIHGYPVSLSSCGCQDFCHRKLPCKHIYAAAIDSAINLPFTQAQYELACRDWKYVPLFLGSRSFNFAAVGAEKLDTFWATTVCLPHETNEPFIT
jgi:hypothetical protein